MAKSTTIVVVERDKRRAILAGALTVFARDGYTRASIDAIAAQAIVSTRTIYNHFQCKAHLFQTVIQESVFTRRGVDRILRYGFELARTRGRKRLTSATKSNGISLTMPFWDSRAELMGKEYPDIHMDHYHIDILAAHFVQRPERFDVVVASNLFGDILSDLGSACTGTIGIAPSANLNPERNFPSMFEPVHGSAPDIFGRNISNPIGQIWSGAMMLEHLGHADAARIIVSAIERVLNEGPRTPDLGGTASTQEVGRAIADAVCALKG